MVVRSSVIETGVTNLDVRPKRAAYLIRTGSRSQFLAAVQRASSRWGGIQEPIVPISQGGRLRPAQLQFLEEAQPDILFDLSSLSGEARQRVAQACGLTPSPVELESRPFSGAHLSIVNDFPSHVIAGDTSSLMAAVGAGSFSTWNESDELEEATGTAAQTSTDPLELAIAQLSGTTLIGATASRCGEISMSGVFGGPHFLYIAEEGSLREALWFWNIRALFPVRFEPRLTVFTTLEVARETSFADALRDALIRSEFQTTPDINLVSLTVSNPALSGVRRRLKVKAHRGPNVTSHFGAQPDPDYERSASLQLDPRQFVFGNRTPGMRSVVPTTYTHKTLVRADSPVRFRGGGRVIVGLSGQPWLQVPKSKKVAELFIRNAIPRHNRLEVETNAQNTYQFQLDIPPPEHILNAFINDRGYRFELSVPGRLAQGLWDRLDPESLAKLSDPKGLSVVRALTSPRSATLVNQVAELLATLDGEALALSVARLAAVPTRQANQPLDSIVSRTGMGAAEIAAFLPQMIAAGLVARGWVVDCPVCGMLEFIPISSVIDRPTCSGCASSADYLPDHRGLEPQVHYRLNSLLDRASDQGVLAHIYAASALGLENGNAAVALGINVYPPGDPRAQPLAEIDIFAIRGDQVFVGEAKSSAMDFTLPQIERDVRWSVNLGATTHVVACLQPIPAEILQVCADLCEEVGLSLRAAAPESY